MKVNERTLFSCSDLSFSYDEEITIKNLSFSVEEGEKIVLLGKNGSGKSTLFQLMTSVLQPSSGKRYWRGEEYTRKRKFLNKLYSQIGFVFQNPDEQLFAASVEQEISFGAVNLGLEEEEVRRRVNEAMLSTDTLKYKDKALEELSFGERKRVSIADLLVMDSKLLLLDEPTAWLDYYNSREITRVLNDLNSDGMALICSTHDVNWAWQFAKRILVLEAGKLVFDGPAEELFSDLSQLDDLGIERPMVLEAYRILEKQGLKLQPEKLPRSFADLEACCT